MMTTAFALSCPDEYKRLVSKGIPVMKILGKAHQNHPCTKWVRESIENFLYLWKLNQLLNKEWQFRFGHYRDHLAYTKMKNLGHPKLPYVDQTPFPLVMPDQFRSEDPVKSYRDFFVGAKSHLATWTNREVPSWFPLLDVQT
jgi:hypothetical protein